MHKIWINLTTGQRVTYKTEPLIPLKVQAFLLPDFSSRLKLQCCQWPSACPAPRVPISSPKSTLSRPTFQNHDWCKLRSMFCVYGDFKIFCVHNCASQTILDWKLQDPSHFSTMWFLCVTSLVTWNWRKSLVNSNNKSKDAHVGSNLLIKMGKTNVLFNNLAVFQVKIP